MRVTDEAELLSFGNDKATSGATVNLYSQKQSESRSVSCGHAQLVPALGGVSSGLRIRSRPVPIRLADLVVAGEFTRAVPLKNNQ